MCVNLNTPLLMVDMTCRLRVNKDTEDFNNTTNQLNLTGAYKTLRLKATENTFPSVHLTFSRIDNSISPQTRSSDLKSILAFNRINTY